MALHNLPVLRLTHHQQLYQLCLRPRHSKILVHFLLPLLALANQMPKLMFLFLHRLHFLLCKTWCRHHLPQDLSRHHLL